MGCFPQLSRGIAVHYTAHLFVNINTKMSPPQPTKPLPSTAEDIENLVHLETMSGLPTLYRHILVLTIPFP